MWQTFKDKLVAFLATPNGHAAEHAITAAGATSLGLLTTAFVHNGGTVHLTDLTEAWIAFVSGVSFGVRTLIRNAAKPTSDPTKLTK